MIAIQETVSGQQRAWTLLEKLGEGDAGEVYRVEAMLDRRLAILKRPRRNSFASDAIRQSTQIEKEAHVLTALERLDAPLRLAPALVDQAKPGSEFSDRFFIIITPAPGLNLGYLARVARFASTAPLQPGDPQPNSLPPIEHRFVEQVAARGRIPDLLILRSFASLLDFMVAAHTLEAETPTGHYFGILWNDVKPDHIFWDTTQSRITLIDWGNAQFLEADGATRDRLHSRMGDYQQFLDEMGRFLADANPDLHARLEWPQEVILTGIYTEGILPLRERLTGLLETETAALAAARQEEAAILFDAPAGLDAFERLVEVHQHIQAGGENPDYASAESFFYRLGQSLIENGDLEGAADLCRRAADFPFMDGDTSRLLTDMARQAAAGVLAPGVLQAAMSGDWHTALWDMRRASLRPSNTLQWENWYEAIRGRMGLLNAVRPLVALNRLIHSLQSAALSGQEADDCTSLLSTLREEIRPRWTEFEPDPPNSGVDYREIEAHTETILWQQPEAGAMLLRSLEQPRMHVALVLDAWERKDFDTARRALRQLLVWDPDRTRVFHAERALQSAPDFLAEVGAGLSGDENLSDFIPRLELAARDLRNQVGPAVWLDSMLDALKQLRKGAEPTEVLLQHTEVRDELGWLVSLEPRRPLLASPDHPLILERLPQPDVARPLLLGVRETELNGSGGISLGEPLDTWVPEARGSSARLFLGEASGVDGERRQVAMKLMRPDRLDYALPLFSEEVRILTMLRDVPGVVAMLECGFIELDGTLLPPEDRHASADLLQGRVQRFGPDSVHNFLGDLEKRASAGWIPYLALEKMERQDNLLLLTDTGHTRGRFLPLLESLVIAQQICDILEVAHTRSIVYRDHKILHYYWQTRYNGVFMIDWNVAKRYPNGLSTAEIQFDLVQFGARSLHYIFTGRPAPGALPMGPNRPEEIEAANHSYTTQWTYDDQRLPQDIKDLLESILSGAYDSARRLREDLNIIYKKLSELI